MAREEDDHKKRSLADRRPESQVDDSPTDVPDIAGEDTPSATDPPNQWRGKDKRDEESNEGPPTRA